MYPQLGHRWYALDAQLHMPGMNTQQAPVRQQNSQLPIVQSLTVTRDFTSAPQPGQVTTSERVVHTTGSGRWRVGGGAATPAARGGWATFAPAGTPAAAMGADGAAG